MLIAEFCQNHNGNFSTLLEMIAAAADSGATHAKIQTIFADDLSYRVRFEDIQSTEGSPAGMVRPYEAEYQRLKSLELTQDEQAKFVRECERKGLIPMTTVFNLTTIPLVKETGIRTVKIASYDCASFPLVEAAADNFEHVVVSTGATFDDEIARTAEILAAKNATFTLMHCVTIYPTPMSEMHLSRLNVLQRFTSRIGLSSHPDAETNGIEADKIAMAMGVNAIERHFTVLDRSATRDGRVSILPKDLRRIREFMDMNLKQRRENVDFSSEVTRVAMGNATRALSEIELQNRDYYRGRFINRTSKGPRNNWDENIRLLVAI